MRIIRFAVSMSKQIKHALGYKYKLYTFLVKQLSVKIYPEVSDFFFKFCCDTWDFIICFIYYKASILYLQTVI